MNLKAVIFDMDGVITDTQHFHDAANAEILQSYGASVTQGDLAKYAGIPNKKVFQEIFNQYHITANIDEALTKKWNLVKQRTKQIDSVPGIISFIKNLSEKNILLAVASSCREDFISHVLETLKITQYFSAVVSGDKLEKGKPYPDIFLFAAEKLSKKPEGCIVIEDAPAGVAAAKAAGMKCIAITTTHKLDQLKQADRIIDSFSELTVDDIIRL